jgi:hypothetical protein
MISMQKESYHNESFESDSDGSLVADMVDEQVDNRSSSIVLRTDNYHMGNFARVKGKPI